VTRSKDTIMNRSRAAVLMIATIAIALTLNGCNRLPTTDADVAQRTVPVRLGPVDSGPTLPGIETSGLVAAHEELKLAFKVGGVIKNIDVREGDRVIAGQRLAELELVEVNAGVEQARQAHIKASQDLARGEKLYAEQVVTLEQLEALRSAEASARAGLNAAAFNRRYAVIEAPRDGLIQRRHAEPGETVAAGTPVLDLGADAQGYVVRASLADREVVKLNIGDVAQVRLDAYAGELLSGTVSMIGAAADPRSGTFPVEVSIDAGDRRLASGMVAKLSLTPSAGALTSLAYVPIAAIVEGHGRRASVYAVEDGKARRRSVEIAFIDGDRVALQDGPSAGSQVVTDGALFLTDGDSVRVQN
jgi:RND family efflux transporter MFP subunit